MVESQNNVCCPKPGAGGEKLKVLAIHGYRQNAEVFRQKTGSFRKMVHKWVQFTYVTAPHKVILVDELNNDGEEVNIGQSADEEQYGWFFNRDNKTYRGIRKGGPAVGFEESLKFIEKVVEEQGPFNGIMGFSQGACFVGLLCDLQARGMLPYKFDFAIMASGFKSDCLPHKKYYSEPISIPTLHIYGETDNIIPTEMSKSLATVFGEPLEISHPGGHYLPATAVQKKDYQTFFKLFMN
ncbi:PREDICTED: esterase AGAP003155 [Nicrophorus vespilloides]|uniref:Esterase AGAP003155 n=1 Tax=Nicrophorus vespilloides TaxID=110193 RepID=A0ABM1MT91_NICVS|nr:PREDICTED: esterase AGAP003155 [Nicrophorus vespilloides]